MALQPYPYKRGKRRYKYDATLLTDSNHTHYFTQNWAGFKLTGAKIKMNSEDPYYLAYILLFKTFFSWIYLVFSSKVIENEKSKELKEKRGKPQKVIIRKRIIKRKFTLTVGLVPTRASQNMRQESSPTLQNSCALQNTKKKLSEIRGHMNNIKSINSKAITTVEEKIMIKPFE